MTRKQHAAQLPKRTASGKSSYGLVGICYNAKQLVACNVTCITGTHWLMRMRFICVLVQFA